MILFINSVIVFPTIIKLIKAKSVNKFAIVMAIVIVIASTKQVVNEYLSYILNSFLMASIHDFMILLWVK